MNKTSMRKSLVKSYIVLLIFTITIVFGLTLNNWYQISKKNVDAFQQVMNQQCNFTPSSDETYSRIPLKNIANATILLAYKSTNQSSNHVKSEQVLFRPYTENSVKWLIITDSSQIPYLIPMLITIGIALLITLLSIGISIYLWIRRMNKIIRPIKELHEITTKFMQGDRFARVIHTSSNEIGELATSFNLMADEMNSLIMELEENVKKRTNELEMSHEELLLILDSAAEGIVGVDVKGLITFCNKSALRMLGYTYESELIQTNYQHLFYHSLENREEQLDKKIHYTHEAFMKKNGDVFQVEYYSNPKYHYHQFDGAVINFMDITERLKIEENILYLSYHDQLTGLFNRRHFDEFMKTIDSSRNYPLSLIMGDVNGLKFINDTFGHEKGDELLIETARVISKVCREGDLAVRLGGDEFVIVLPNTSYVVAMERLRWIERMAKESKVVAFELSIALGCATKIEETMTINTLFKIAEDEMYKNKFYKGSWIKGITIDNLMNAIDEKHKGEGNHSQNVSDLCAQMGKALELNPKQIEELKLSGLVHDIGKIAIDEHLLCKKGPLTDKEYKEIKKHPEIGYRILNTMKNMESLSNYVLCHHEHYDGTGYPQGLKGEQIPLYSRIIAVVEAFDEMVTLTPYNAAKSIEDAIKELQLNSGKQFDPQLVTIFIEQLLKKSL